MEVVACGREKTRLKPICFPKGTQEQLQQLLRNPPAPPTHTSPLSLAPLGIKNRNLVATSS